VEPPSIVQVWESPEESWIVLQNIMEDPSVNRLTSYGMAPRIDGGLFWLEVHFIAVG